MNPSSPQFFAERSAAKFEFGRRTFGRELRRLLWIDALTGLSSVVGFVALPTRWATWLDVDVAAVAAIAALLSVFVLWIAGLLVAPSVSRARVLIAGNGAYAVACAVVAVVGASTSLSTLAVALAAVHAAFVGALAWAQARALRAAQ